MKRILRFAKINFKLFFRNIKLNWKFKKKNVIIKYSVLIIIFLLLFFSLRNKVKIINKSTHTKEIVFIDTTHTLQKYLFHLRYLESSDNHLARRNRYVVLRTKHGLDTVNAYSQYIGFYQLGESARRNLCNICPEMKKYTNEEFWKSRFIQHKAVICWLILLKKNLKSQIKKYKGKYHGSFYITESGLLAMAHLVGSNTVKNWLKRDFSLSYTYSIKDGFNKNGVDYLQQLGRYNLNLNRFIDNKGNILDDKINRYVQNIIENRSNKKQKIKTENKFVVVDSTNYIKDSTNFKFFN